MTIFRGSVFRESVFRGSVFNGGIFFNPGHYTFCSYTTNADSQDGTIKLSLPAGKSIVIHWGDGNTTDITGAVTKVEYTNTYAVTGTYDITVTGDYNDISYLQFTGSGSWSGDIKYLPNEVTVISCYSANTFYGNIANLHVNLKFITIYGHNEITGELSTALGLYGIDIRGNNTIFGNLAEAPMALSQTYLSGQNTISEYTGPRVWVNNQNIIYITPVSPGGLSTSEVDALLHDLAQVTTWTGSKVITLTGTNQPRSSASDADVTTLTNAGVTVTTNVYTFCSYTTSADAQDGTIRLSLPAGKSITIHWGDGNTTDITGAVSYVEYTNTYAVIGDYNITVTGDYNDISTLYFGGSGSWSGDAKYWPNNLINFKCYVANTFFGDLANMPVFLVELIIYGHVAISGDLADAPAGLENIIITGYNTIFGDLADAPVNLTSLTVSGYNTITGEITNCPAGLTLIYIYGSNTISGDISDKPLNLTTFKITGHNTITDYSTSVTWADNQDTIKIVPVSPGGLSTVEVDALLHDLAQVTTWAGDKIIVLTGSNEPRSSASDADVTTLTNAGVTVTTNT